MKLLIKKIEKEYLNTPLWIWGVLVCLPLLFYSIYCYSDIIWTTKNGLTVWYVLLGGGNIGEFYTTAYPLDSKIELANYDFFIYTIFAIWDFPLYIYEKITGISFKENYVALVYAKSIIVPFLILCIREIFNITFLITEDREKADWSSFSFIFSIMVFQTIIIIGGYEVIAIYFTLCGLRAYLENRNLKFIICSICAVSCKLFAIWFFLPLALLKWKKVWNVIGFLVSSISVTLISKVYFGLYEKINGLKPLSGELESEIDIIQLIDNYLWSSEAPLAISSMPLFFFFTFLLWVKCWFNKKKLSNKEIIYIALIGMSIFILTCETHPQWIILVTPYIVILECSNWNNLSNKIFLEICFGISYFLWKVRRSPQCYSYNVVNNMLQFESGDREFWYTGIWMFISKIADITHISIDHIWTLIRSVLVASFLMLLFYLIPKEDGDKFPSKGSKYFYWKAMCSIMILLVPLLGIVARNMLE